MSANTLTLENGTLTRVASVLISQPKPERSPYFDLAKKWGIQIDWRPFIHVEPVAEKEFRRLRVRPDKFAMIIFTSRGGIDHFFRICDKMRCEMPASTKYFCLSEAIANYLQKFIIYRKRKVFVGKKTIQDLSGYLMKHRDEHFLLPCSNLGAKPVTAFLDSKEIKYTEAEMYRTVSSDLSDLADITYDVLVFFSPLGIQSLYENFPSFEQKKTRIAVYGKSTSKAVEDRGLAINIAAPTADIPSMSMALDKYLQTANK